MAPIKSLEFHLITCGPFLVREAHKYRLMKVCHTFVATPQALKLVTEYIREQLLVFFFSVGVPC